MRIYVCIHEHPYTNGTWNHNRDLCVYLCLVRQRESRRILHIAPQSVEFGRSAHFFAVRPTVEQSGILQIGRQCVESSLLKWLTITRPEIGGLELS